MKSAIISILMITVPAITCFSGENAATPGKLVEAATGQIVTPEASQTQRNIQHYEKVITEYKQGKWKLNDRELQMVLMNLSDLYSEAGDKEKSRQYQNELGEHENKHPEIKLRDDVRKDTERSIEEHEVKLKEFRQAKRDYRDAYYLLRVLTADYNRLRQKGKALEYIREVEALKIKYPDLVSDPPQELSDHRKAREDLARKREELIKKPFTPKDSWAKVFKSSNNVALVYQYRLEFYKLPADIEVYLDTEGDGELRKYGEEPYASRVGHIKFSHVNSVYKIKTKRHYSDPRDVYHTTSEVRLKPHKTMTFRRHCYHAPLEQEQGTLLLCTSPSEDGGYMPTTKEEWDERIMLGDEWPGMKWLNKNAQIDKFCGVVDIKGNLMGEIPFEVQFPDSVLEPLNLSPDGKKAVLGIASWGPEPADGIETFVDHREYLLWEYPDKIRRIAISDSGVEVYDARGKAVWKLFEKH